MNIETITEPKHEAAQKWREYVQAEKQTKSPLYTDLKKAYNQIKNGRKIIDIHKVIQKGGLNSIYPALAIAQAISKTVWCNYWNTGTVHYVNASGSRWNNGEGRHAIAEDVNLTTCLPPFNIQEYQKARFLDQYRDRFMLQAPVPLIPPKFLPTRLTSDYYILWEVEQWKKVAPTDPWLLKRITKTLFVVLAGWDLTKLEKSVMNGRMS